MKPAPRVTAVTRASHCEAVIRELACARGTGYDGVLRPYVNPMRLAWYSWLIGFGLTLACELPVALWLLRRLEPTSGRRVVVILLANLLTHPLVWFFFPHLPLGRPLRITVSELWAFGAEAFFYGFMTTRPTRLGALRASLLANATSFGIGWFIVSRYAHWFYAAAP